MLNAISHFPTVTPGVHNMFKVKWFPPLILLKGQSILIRSVNWYHFLSEGLPVLYLSEQVGHPISSFDQCIIYGASNNNVLECISSYGIDISKVRYATNEYRNFLCEELVIANYFGRWGSWIRDVYKPVIDKFLSKGGSYPDKIYVSRKRTKVRRVVNEEELGVILKGLGFVIIDNEDLSFRQQLNYFYNAKIIMGPHGANLANIVFSKPGSVLVEVANPFYKTYYHDCYWRLAQNMGMVYNLIYAKETIPVIHDDGRFDKWHVDFVIDLEQTRLFLESILQKENPTDLSW